MTDPDPPTVSVFFTSDEFREFLQEVATYEDVVERHCHSSDQNMIESLASRAEDFRECLVIIRDMAQSLPACSSNSVELVESLEQLLGIFQEKVATYLSVLERIDEESWQHSSHCLPDLSFTVTRMHRVQGRGGRPFTSISRTQLEAFIDMGFKYTVIAKMLCVSERTLLRRRAELGLPIGHHQIRSTMDDNELDQTVSEILQVHVYCKCWWLHFWQPEFRQVSCSCKH